MAQRHCALTDPVRITVFSDRIELLSPGRLARSPDPERFQRGEATPTWRSQPLAWFLKELHFAQGEGQGLPTIKRRLLENGSPAPRIELGPESVQYTIFARRLSEMASPHRSLELLTLVGDFDRAYALLAKRIAREGYDSEGVILLANILASRQDWAQLRKYTDRILSLPYESPRGLLSAQALFALADSLKLSLRQDAETEELTGKLLSQALPRMQSREDFVSVLKFTSRISPFEAEPLLERAIRQYPDLRTDARFLRLEFSILSAMWTRLLQVATDWLSTAEAKNRAESECRSLFSRLTDVVSWAQELPSTHPVRSEVTAKFSAIESTAKEHAWV